MKNMFHGDVLVFLIPHYKKIIYKIGGPCVQ